jgi:hypothetical protein
MVVAKNDRTHHALSKLFAAHDLERIYKALVWGAPKPERGTVEAALGRHPVDRKRMAVRRSGGKAARTEYWLEKRFGPFQNPPQHLYEGEKGHDVVPGQAQAFEVDEGDDADVSDLEALIEAVDAEAGSEPWSTRIAPYVDLGEMTKMWAVEKYIDHWDGYSGHAIAGLRPNNYYLYSNAAGQFQMLPWGADQTYIPTIGVGTPGRELLFDGEGGVLYRSLRIIGF